MSFQERVAAAHVALFDGDPTDVAERRDRYGEESLEVLQAFDMTPEQAHALVDYVFKRPKGEPKKEIGAASLTLTSLCVVAGYDRNECEEADLEQLVQPETIARIRAKRATRHGRGPLPGFDPEPRAAPAPSSILEGDMASRSHLWNSAIEACAQLIEKNVVMDTSAGKVLKPREDGNRDGLHYAAAIRALVTNHGSKNDLHPEYVTSEDGTDHGCKSTLHPGYEPPAGGK